MLHSFSFLITLFYNLDFSIETSWNLFKTCIIYDKEK